MAESYWRSVHELALEQSNGFHMPGHANRVPAGGAWSDALPQSVWSLDQSEIGGLDYLHDPIGPLRDAQERAAGVFGAERTWFLVNGATGGNQAAIWSVARPGGTLIMMRRSHQSVHAGVTFAGLGARCLTPLPFEPLDGLFGFDVNELQRLLATEKDVVGVHVTSPDYYGFRLPLKLIAEACHAFRVPLIVDEAHGTHLAFLAGEETALSAGADIVVHSPHKALGSLTQSALLHAQGGWVDTGRVGEALMMLQSSSPSSLLTMSLDAVIEEMAEVGAALWSERAAWGSKLRSAEATSAVFGSFDPLPAGVASVDPCKLVVRCASLGLPVIDVRERLMTDHQVLPEFTDHRNMIFSIMRGTTLAEVEALVAVLVGLRQEPSETEGAVATSAWPRRAPVQSIDARTAMQSPRVVVSLDQARDRIAARAVTPYPPGIPLVLAGEVITDEVVFAVEGFLRSGVIVRGLIPVAEGYGLSCVAEPANVPAGLL